MGRNNESLRLDGVCSEYNRLAMVLNILLRVAFMAFGTVLSHMSYGEWFEPWQLGKAPRTAVTTYVAASTILFVTRTGHSHHPFDLTTILDESLRGSG